MVSCRRLWRPFLVMALATFMLAVAAPWAPADAASASAIDSKARAALDRLYAETPEARTIAEEAVAILVFPEIAKGGILVGGQAGEGVLLRGGEPDSYYGLAAASFGLQLGVQTFSYVMMFMTEDALGYLDTSAGFEVGVGPSVVLVDEGVAQSVTTATMGEDVYAFVFGQQGLMAGAGIQGSKITRIEPDA